MKKETAFFKILFYFLTLQYCIGFAIYQNESATGIHPCVPHPEPSSLLPPHTIPLGLPSSPAARNSFLKSSLKDSGYMYMYG